ncbi:MAG: tRNA pseudouridine(55) synthase TruB [Bacteroidales bacterium]|nr:tRNA pseudouridine(55) synthase TruB [Bacteroidales bacterium]
MTLTAPENFSNQHSILVEAFTAGKVLLFNKPLYWTSFDLVNKVKIILRQQLQLRKIKVGHAGTLDPLATGLMIVCTGKETRKIELYQSQPKEYIARLTLGATTPSFDLETAVDQTYPFEHIDRQLVEKSLGAFLGDQLQQPPDFSARMVNGTRAYELARKGKTVDLSPKPITIYDMALLKFELPVIEISVRCSKGTYIRALARDIGKQLGSGAYLSGLVRTAIGNFLLKDAINIDEFENNFVFL